MLLELFSVLLIIGLTLIVLGFIIDIPLLSIIGFTFLFLISFPLINNTLMYKTGSTITENSTATLVIDNYASFSDSTKTYGFYLAIISAIGFILVVINTTRWGLHAGGEQE